MSADPAIDLANYQGAAFAPPAGDEERETWRILNDRMAA